MFGWNSHQQQNIVQKIAERIQSREQIIIIEPSQVNEDQSPKGFLLIWNQ